LPGKDGIELKGEIEAMLSDHAFTVRLPNGHKVTTAVPVRLRDSLSGLKTGTLVRIKMSPFDMSKGRIVGIK